MGSSMVTMCFGVVRLIRSNIAAVSAEPEARCYAPDPAPNHGRKGGCRGVTGSETVTRIREAAGLTRVTYGPRE